MAQLSLYVGEETLGSLREEARRAGVSISKYAATILEARSRGCGWPAGWGELFGSSPDFPSVEQIRAGADDSLDDDVIL